jgi:hypothetical protein
MQELRAGQIIPNSPQVRSSSPSRMPAPPARFDRATAPVLNPGNIGGNLGSDFRAPQIETCVLEVERRKNKARRTFP